MKHLNRYQLIALLMTFALVALAALRVSWAPIVFAALSVGATAMLVIGSWSTPISVYTKRCLLLIACVAAFNVGCAAVMPAAKTANDIARDLCNVTLEAEDVPVGLSVEDACKVHTFLDPFLRAILGAQREAAAQVAASSGGDSAQ